MGKKKNICLFTTNKKPSNIRFILLDATSKIYSQILEVKYTQVIYSKKKLV